MPKPPTSLSDAQLIAEVRCRRCAYDLRGLSLDSRCPECGLEIWLSVQDTVDPAASRLPKLRDPSGVGNALVWLVFCGFVAALLMILHGALVVAGTAPQIGWLPWLMLPEDLLLFAGLIVIAGLWSVYKFSPPGNRQEDVAVRADLRILALALVGFWAACMLLWVQERTVRFGVTPGGPGEVVSVSLMHIAMALCAAGAFRGLRGVIETIGRRSREYRRARGGKQGVKPLIAACIGVAVGNLLRIAGALWRRQWLEEIGTAIESVSAIMLLIGLGYLLVNALWIRRALRRPPPRLDEIIRVHPSREGGNPESPD